MFDFKILYKLKILTTGKFRVNVNVSPEIVSDDTQVNIAQKISTVSLSGNFIEFRMKHLSMPCRVWC